MALPCWRTMPAGRRRETGGRAIAELKIELEREEDGRWIAEIPALPGVLVYGATREEAIVNVEILALRVLAERLEAGEPAPDLGALFVAA